jgi:hypothetical protein
MKTTLRSQMVLALGLLATSGAIGQKTSSEYDDLYYIPSDNKSAPVEVKQAAAAPEAPAYEPSDYEKYINSLENQKRGNSGEYRSTDTLEYVEDREYIDTQTKEKDGNTYITNNYYNTDEYSYSSRIRRFYDPFYSAGYYNSWYYDPFWYVPGWSFGLSIGYPYSGFGFSYGWPGNYGYYPYYNSWYYSPWGYGSYWNGYNHGYYNGYYNGYYGDYYGYNDGYYHNNRPVYYGPRRTIESNRIATANPAKTYSANRNARPVSSAANRSVSGTSATGNTRVASPVTSRTPAKSISNPVVSGQRTETGTPVQRKSIASAPVSPQDRPVYTKPGSATTQSRPSYSGTPNNNTNMTGSQSRTTTNNGTSATPAGNSQSSNRPEGSNGATPSYSRPSSSAPTYSRPSSSAPTYSRPSSSAPTYSRPSSGSSGSSSGRSSSPSSSSPSSSGGSHSQSSGRR